MSPLILQQVLMSYNYKFWTEDNNETDKEPSHRIIITLKIIIHTFPDPRHWVQNLNCLELVKFNKVMGESSAVLVWWARVTEKTRARKWDSAQYKTSTSTVKRLKVLQVNTTSKVNLKPRPNAALTMHWRLRRGIYIIIIIIIIDNFCIALFSGVPKLTVLIYIYIMKRCE